MATTSTVRLRNDGKNHVLQLNPGMTLLDALREHAGLNGTKMAETRSNGRMHRLSGR